MLSRAFKVLTICRHCVVSLALDLYKMLLIQELYALIFIGLNAYLVHENGLDEVTGTSIAIKKGRHVP